MASYTSIEYQCTTPIQSHDVIATASREKVKSVAWNKSGSLLATCGRDKTVWIWEYDEGEGDYDCVTVLSDHTADVKTVRWLPHKDVLVSASYDDTIRLWAEGFDDWFLLETLVEHRSTVWGVAADGTGERLASVGDDQRLILWRHFEDDLPRQGNDRNKYGKWRSEAILESDHKGTIYSVDWAPTAADAAAAIAAAKRVDTLSPDGTSGGHDGGGLGAACLATGAADNSLRVFYERGEGDGAAFALDVEAENAHAGDVNCVRWSPSGGGVLASCGDDELVRVWRYSPPGC